jgi:hypothetical protein
MVRVCYIIITVKGMLVYCSPIFSISNIFAAGRFDLYLFTYSCSGCDRHFSSLTLEKIISEGYWPGGPKNFKYVFCEDVFRVWDSLRKFMPGTSETAFLKSLASISSEKGRVSILY